MTAKRHAFRIELFPTWPVFGKTHRPHWTSHIVRVRGGKIIWSSTKQGYSRRIDALHEAEEFIAAVKADAVEIAVEGK